MCFMQTTAVHACTLRQVSRHITLSANILRKVHYKPYYNKFSATVHLTQQISSAFTTKSDYWHCKLIKTSHFESHPSFRFSQSHTIHTIPHFYITFYLKYYPIYRCLQKTLLIFLSSFLLTLQIIYNNLLI